MKEQEVAIYIHWRFYTTSPQIESVGLGWDAWLDATLDTKLNGIDLTVGKVLRPRILLKPVPNFLVLIFWYQIFLTR